MSESNKAAAGKAQMIDVTHHGVDQALTALIEHALEMKASDLFLVSNEQHLAAQVRAMGIVRPIAILPLDLGRKVIGTIKARSGMDLNEKRRPLDGRWIYENGDDTVDLRINMIPTLYGEDFAIRILDRSTNLISLEQLGLSREQYAALSGMVSTPSGLILICGPTGSGKTATQYACLSRLNDGQRKINTIEDPVEFSISGLRQSQVNPAVGLTFLELLRSVLRQSPDVIMIGEIRDAETAQTAVHAANSGQLVFATIHAPAAANAVQSMRSLGVHTHFLATGLRGVIAQRLVRTLCPKCKSSFDLAEAPHTFDEVRPWLSESEGKALYAPVGCEACGGTGYAARSGVFEVLTVSKAVRNLISDNRPTREIRDQAMAEKMLNFRQAALLKVAHGETSTEEVFRVIPSEHLLED
jgi:type II secretory ATPase GspE/PulE/Tfp pilus assembly ATPase PilB-like protein